MHIRFMERERGQLEGGETRQGEKEGGVQGIYEMLMWKGSFGTM